MPPDFKLPPWLLLVPLVIIAGGFWVGKKSGYSNATVDAQVRIDSLTNALHTCQQKVDAVRLTAVTAEGFLTNYDNRISELSDELRRVKNSYADTLAVLRRYNSADAERAIAAYYQRRRSSQPDRLTGVDDAVDASRSGGTRLSSAGKPAAQGAGSNASAADHGRQPEPKRKESNLR